MASKGINKVIIVGNLGKDPEMKYTASGSAVCNITIATSESWNDKATGEKVEKTEWHRVVSFQKLAEIMGEYLKKGSQVYVEGKLTTRKWQDKDGTDRYTTEIVADQMQMLGSKPEAEKPKAQGFREKPVTNETVSRDTRAAYTGDNADEPAFIDDELPF